jgi:hypothetical protein
VWDAIAEITSDAAGVREEEEAWMAYVRGQLAMFFPDFFPASSGGQGEDQYDPGYGNRFGGEGLGDERGNDGVEEAEGDESFAEPYPLAFADPALPTSQGENTIRQPSSLRTLGNDPRPGLSLGLSLDRDRLPRLVSDTSTVSSFSLPTPRNYSGTDFVQQTGSDATTATVTALGQPVISVPDVRDEISAMREEMERLRSFVGRLAGGMGGGPSTGPSGTEESVGESSSGARMQETSRVDGGLAPDVPNSDECDATDGSDKSASRPVVPDLLLKVSPSFPRTHAPKLNDLKNLVAATSVIRALDAQLHPHRESSDPAIFSEANMLALEEMVRSGRFMSP